MGFLDGPRHRPRADIGARVGAGLERHGNRRRVFVGVPGGLECRGELDCPGDSGAVDGSVGTDHGTDRRSVSDDAYQGERQAERRCPITSLRKYTIPPCLSASPPGGVRIRVDTMGAHTTTPTCRLRNPCRSLYERLSPSSALRTFGRTRAVRQRLTATPLVGTD